MSTALSRQVLSMIGILAVTYGGCAGELRPPATEPLRSTEALHASQETSPPEPAPAPRNALRSLLVSPITEEPSSPREMISFSVKNVDIKDVLLGLSRLSNANIIFEQDITGKVSVDLKDVTVEEALKSLLPPMGLEFIRDGRTIHVTKQKMQTRIFPLNYVVTRRKGESQVAATSGGTTGATTTGATTPTTTTTAGAENTGFSKVSSEDVTNLWDEVKATLDKLLSPQGKYSLNPMAGIVVVTDFPSQLDRIAKYFEAVETSVRRQVLIQAEVLEIKLTEDFEYGIDFSGTKRLGKFKGLEPSLVPGRAKPMITQLLKTGTGILNIGIADATVAMVLDLLQKEGKLRVLSRPSVSTLNNQKAIVKVATDDVFFEKTTTLTPEGVSQTSEISRTVTIGVVLSVTPQIASDGYIIMNIHPSVTDSTLTRTSPTGQTSRPVVDVRETNVVLRVKDGESIIIAGLVKTKTDRQVKRVPLLSSIPILGLLFQQIDESKENTELVIKITPRIVGGES